MHELMRTGDCIDRAGSPAMRTADAKGLVNRGDRFCHDRFGIERQWFGAKQVRDSPDRVVAARGAKIDWALATCD